MPPVHRRLRDRLLIAFVLACAAQGVSSCGSDDLGPSNVTTSTKNIYIGAVGSNTLFAVYGAGDGGPSVFLVDGSTRYERLDVPVAQRAPIGLADLLAAYRAGSRQRVQVEFSAPAQSAWAPMATGSATTATAVRLLETIGSQPGTSGHFGPVPTRQLAAALPLSVVVLNTTLWVFPWTVVDPEGDFSSLGTLPAVENVCVDVEGFVMSPDNWPGTLQATRLKVNRVNARGSCF